MSEEVRDEAWWKRLQEVRDEMWRRRTKDNIIVLSAPRRKARSPLGKLTDLELIQLINKVGSQREAARQLGVHQSAISQWLRRRGIKVKRSTRSVYAA